MLSKYRLYLLVAFCLIFVSLLSAQETQPPEKPSEGVSLNFLNTKLSSLLEYLAKREGKPLLYDARFPKDAPVDLISPPNVTIPPEKLSEVIESVLRMKGFTLVTTGPVIKIVPSGEAREQPTVVNSPEDLDKLAWTDRIVTQVIPLKSANAQTLINLLMQLKSKEGTLIVHPESNSLIITEFASNIRRLNEVIKQLDVESEPYQTITRQLKYASAVTVRNSLNEYINIMQAAQPRMPSLTKKPFVVLDERTNSIIVFAVENDMKRLTQIIDTFDSEFAKKESQVYTYKLANINAEDAAKILDIFPKQIAALPASVLKPQLSITPDKVTNTLVIMAPPSLYAEMEKLLKEIDVRRAQVLIETAITELNTEQMVELGIELASISSPSEEGTGFGGTYMGLSKTTLTGKIPNVTEGLTLGIWKKTEGNIPFLLHAAQKSAGINILASPRLLTNDNSPASITISEQIPYDTKTIGPDGTVTGITFGGYLDAGIKLEITPHLCEDGSLRLEISQEVAQFVSSAYSETRPGKNTRLAKTTVTIPDRKTVIIGGLTRDNKSKKETRVPLLGDLPLLGPFFRSTRDEVTKTHLCIFITPQIMKQHSDLIEESSKQQRSIDEHKK